MNRDDTIDLWRTIHDVVKFNEFPHHFFFSQSVFLKAFLECWNTNPRSHLVEKITNNADQKKTTICVHAYRDVKYLRHYHHF